MSTKPGRQRSLSIPLAGSWTAIPNDMLRDTSLTRDERLLAALLRVYAGLDVKAFPRQAALAELMGCEPRSVQRWLRTLHRRGYVVVTQTIWGNLYTLVEPKTCPNGVLTDTIPGSPPTTQESHAETIPGSPPTTQESSLSLLRSDSWDSDSSSSEETAPLVSGQDDDDPGITIREKGDPRTGKLLKDAGVGGWRTLQAELAHVPYELVARRVNFLLDQGKEPGIIVHSLRELPFSPGTMDEQGPQPWHISPEYRDLFNRGPELAGDDQAGDDQAQQLDRSNPDIDEFLKECDL